MERREACAVTERSRRVVEPTELSPVLTARLGAALQMCLQEERAKGALVKAACAATLALVEALPKSHLAREQRSSQVLPHLLATAVSTFPSSSEAAAACLNQLLCKVCAGPSARCAQTRRDSALSDLWICVEQGMVLPRTLTALVEAVDTHTNMGERLQLLPLLQQALHALGHVDEEEACKVLLRRKSLGGASVASASDQTEITSLTWILSYVGYLFGAGAKLL